MPSYPKIVDCFKLVEIKYLQLFCYSTANFGHVKSDISVVLSKERLTRTECKPAALYKICWDFLIF